MGGSFHKLMTAASLLAFVTMVGCSSSSSDFSDDAEEEFMSEELGAAETDAAPEEGDQLVSTESVTDTPVASASDLEDAEQLDGSDLDQIETPNAPSASAEVAQSGFTDIPLVDDSLPLASPETPDQSFNSSAPSIDGEGELNSYSVRSGDTLMRIAFEQYGDLYAWKKIYEANKGLISDPNNLPKGVTLKIEKGNQTGPIGRGEDRFLIRSGDTLGTISGDVYGTPKKWRKLYEQNSSWIKDPNKIYAGFYIYYTLTPEERQEADQLRNMKPPASAPVATLKDETKQREPSSVK